MSGVWRTLMILVAVMIVSGAIPLVERNEEAMQMVQKRLSNDALIRLLMRNRGAQLDNGSGLKRGGAPFKRSDVERRSVDDEFSNCFLSPVQCMLPTRK